VTIEEVLHLLVDGVSLGHAQREQAHAAISDAQSVAQAPPPEVA
jgi:hypothetical protein